jgi:hypothetical protein
VSNGDETSWRAVETKPVVHSSVLGSPEWCAESTKRCCFATHVAKPFTVFASSLSSFVSGAQYVLLAAEQVERGSMEELVGRVVAAAGIERTVAERAIGIILDFLATEGPPDNVANLIARLPGAAEAIEATRAGAGGGMFGGMGGIMGVGSRLMSVGLDLGEIQRVAHELITYAREKAGDEDLDGIVAAIPGLSQFI